MIEENLLSFALKKFCGVTELDPEVHTLDFDAYEFEVYTVRELGWTDFPELSQENFIRQYNHWSAEC